MYEKMNYLVKTPKQKRKYFKPFVIFIMILSVRIYSAPDILVNELITCSYEVDCPALMLGPLSLEHAVTYLHVLLE